MPDQPPPRHIAPRLASKLRRAHVGHALPPHVKHALQMIAWTRGESLSWVLEQTVYAHFNLRAPKFVGERGPDLEITAPPKLKRPPAHLKIVRTA